MSSKDVLKPSEISNPMFPEKKKVWHIDSRKCIWNYLNVTCVPGSIAGRLLFRVTVQTLWNLLEMGPCWNYCVRRTSSLNGSMLYLWSRSGMGGSDDSKGHFVIKKKIAKRTSGLSLSYLLFSRCLCGPLLHTLLTVLCCLAFCSL